MELVARGANAQRSGDLQLLLAPFNSANYSFESLGLHPRDPRTSHAAVWMYLERIPLVAYGPGVIEPGDSEDRVSLADLAPTTADLIGFDGWPSDREGRGLPGLPDHREDAEGGRHLRLRRRRLERPSPVAERLAEPRSG